MAIVPERLGKMAGLQMLLLCLVITTFPSVVHGFIEGLYCGTENCYECKSSVFYVSKVALRRALACDVYGCGR